MNEFDNISDEQLACFIEDNLCEIDHDCILDAVACDSDMDVLSISYHASKLVDTPNEIVGLPRWNHGLNVAFMPMSIMSHQLRESAFLGDDDEYSDVAAICACEEDQNDLMSFDEFNNDDGSNEKK